MKRLLLLSLFLICMTSMWSQQIGAAGTTIILSEGKIWRNKINVFYVERDTNMYVLTLTIPRSAGYLDVKKGNKISIEFTDSTREVQTIKNVTKEYKDFISLISYRGTYVTTLVFFTNGENFSNKVINRFVVQTNNGTHFVLPIENRFAKQVPQNFKKAMEEAYASYKSKVANDNYFKE